MVLLGRPDRVRRREQHCEQHCQQQNERYRARDVDKGRALKNAKHKRAHHVMQRGKRGRRGAETGRRSGGGRTEGLGGAARSSRAPAAATCRQGARLSLGGFKPHKRARLANDYNAPENGTFVGVA